MPPSRGGVPPVVKATSHETNWFGRLKDTLLLVDSDDEQQQQQQHNTNTAEGSAEGRYDYYRADEAAEEEQIMKATTIASYFLMDYEAGRPPTLSIIHSDTAWNNSQTTSSTTAHDNNNNFVSDQQLSLYRIKFSSLWKWLGIYPATLILFLSYIHHSPIWTALWHLYAVAIFALDLHMTHQLFDDAWFEKSPERRTERHIQSALVVFLLLFGVQNCAWFFLKHPEDHCSTLLVSLFKPLVFFYTSRRARDALEALIMIAKVLARVVVIELFLILAFAAVACHLYYDDDAAADDDEGNFQNLASSWLSLFQLSTGVVNPSLWLPMYEDSRANAIFFVFFIVTCTFYLHSLILSLVFQVYIQAAKEVHHRSLVNKEDSIRYAFLVLSSSKTIMSKQQSVARVHTDMIKKTLQKVRSNYGPLKMKILMELVDPMKTLSLDYSTFRTSMREALGLTVRSARSTSLFTSAVEMLSVLVTGINFLFVILLTSNFQSFWFDATTVGVGTLITFFCLLELGMRCNICTMTYYPMTRLNAVFDGFAAIGALLSCFGICRYLAGHSSGLDYLFTGRAIDMVRNMRFFSMFRDVVERSVNVLPALAGPVFLVLTTIHIFVCLGMVLWGGQVDMEKLAYNEDVETLYYLNNFNSYPEGLVTIFNVLVLNDWHQIAKVFLYADRLSQPFIVYSFFIVVVLIAVCIMLNVITAFFVETFVTRLNKNDIDNDGVITLQKARGEFWASSPRARSLPLLGNQFSLKSVMGDMPIPRSTSSASSESGEVLQFDVFERQGFDSIMETVANEKSNQDDVAKCLCDTLEIVSNFSSDWQGAEFLVCCQPSMNLFQTRKFRDLVAGFLDDSSLHSAIGDLTSKLGSSIKAPGEEDTTNQGEPERLLRQFLHPRDPSDFLDLSVMLLPHVPNLYLFIARRRHVPSQTPRVSAMTR